MRPVLAFVVLAVMLAACGKTEKSGKLGDTFKAGPVRVSAQKVDLHAPVVDDVTGLGRPAAGNTLLGVRVAVCVGRGAAVAGRNFGLELEGGGTATVKFPATNYEDDLEAVFSGDCGEGWVVFEAPDGKRPSVVTFTYDDTGGGNQNRSETHARFKWTV